MTQNRLNTNKCALSVPRVGVEPTSDALQAPAVTTLAISAYLSSTEIYLSISAQVKPIIPNDTVVKK